MSGIASDSGEPQYEVLQNMQSQPSSSSSGGIQNDNHGYMTYYQDDMNNMGGQSSSNPQPIQNYSYQQQQHQQQHQPATYSNSVNSEEMGGTDSGMVDGDTAERIDPPNPEMAKASGMYLDQERFLPIANVARIMKNQIDPQGKLSKEAKECVQECVSEFIAFISSEAAAHCMDTKKKTITADDMLTALEATGFDNYAEPMRILLMKYRQAHKLTGPIHRIHPNYSRPVQFREDPPIQPLFFYTANGRKCTEMNFFNNVGDIIRNDFQRDRLNEELNRHSPDEMDQMDDDSQPVMEEVHQQHHQPTMMHQSNPPIQQQAVGPQTTVVASTIPASKPIIIEEEQIEQQELIMERGTGIIRMPATSPSEGEHSEELIVQDGNQPIAALQHNQMQIYVDAISKQHYAAIEGANGVKLWPIKIVGAPINLTNAPPVPTTMASGPSGNEQSNNAYMYVANGDGMRIDNNGQEYIEAPHQQMAQPRQELKPADVDMSSGQKRPDLKNYQPSSTTSSDETDAGTHQQQFDDHVDMEQGELEEFIVPNNKKPVHRSPQTPQRVTRSQQKEISQKVQPPAPTRMSTRKSARRN